MSARPRRKPMPPERFRFSLYTKAASRAAVVRPAAASHKRRIVPTAVIEELAAPQRTAPLDTAPPVAAQKTMKIYHRRNIDDDLNWLKAFLKRTGGFPVENDVIEAGTDDSYENE